MVFGGLYLAVGAVMLAADDSTPLGLEAALATPARLGGFVFERHWLAVEIVSLLLLIAMVGALYIGKTSRGGAPTEPEEEA